MSLGQSKGYILAGMDSLCSDKPSTTIITDINRCEEVAKEIGRPFEIIADWESSVNPAGCVLVYRYYDHSHEGVVKFNDCGSCRDPIGMRNDRSNPLCNRGKIHPIRNNTLY